MTLVVTLFIITAGLEVLLYVVPALWQSTLIRRYFATLTVPLLAGALAGLVMLAPSGWSIAIGLVGLYRIINILRVAEGRTSKEQLRNVAPQTSLVLIAVQILIVCGWYTVEALNAPTRNLLAVLVGIQLLAAVTMFLSTFRQLRHTKSTAYDLKDQNLYMEDLPSVTVAIPARNETRDLEACLAAVTKSTYPKLEILVLDDCSQFRRTPEIIREFAHAGVRFVKGDTPKTGWLAKNQAYARLTREASGSVILYLGVDILLKPDSIDQLVRELVLRKKRMLCVLPRRQWRGGNQFAIVQASRYAWELALPRRLFNRPPVLSSCWMIYKSDVRKFGGFAAVSRAITPEAYFARRSITGDGYRFMRSNEVLGVESAKSPTAQRSTAIRTRYPSLHRRPEIVALVAASQILLFAMPPIIVLLAIFGQVQPIFGVLTAAVSLLQLSAYTALSRATNTISWYLAPVAAPLSLLADFVILHVSMWCYEFSEVIWKGRNVCVPVMRVEKSLPKLES